MRTMQRKKDSQVEHLPGTHHYIHTSKALNGELEDIPLLCVVRHVACDGVRLASGAHDLIRDVLRACAVSITDDYLRTSWGRA